MQNLNETENEIIPAEFGTIETVGSPPEEKIILTESQAKHAYKLIRILERFFISIDSSKMGKGKSIIVIFLILYMKIKNPVLICLSQLVQMWEKYAEDYGINLTVISYDTLRGMGNSENKKVTLNHGYLKRKGDEYSATKSFKRKLATEGCSFFFDEFHKLKNSGIITTLAVEEICKTIKETRETLGEHCPKSFLHFFSATSMDKTTQCSSFLKMIGIIPHTTLYDNEKISNSSIFDLKNYCKEIDFETTENLWNSHSLGSKSALPIAFDLYTQVIIPNISSYVEDINSDENKQSIYYVDQRIPERAVKLMQIAEEISKSRYPKISRRSREKYKKIAGDDEKDLSEMNGPTHGQVISQIIKTHYIIAKEARRILETVENSKVIIFLDYRGAVNIAAQKLKEYGVVIIEGRKHLSIKDREKRIEKFQQPNIKKRVLIAISTVGTTGYGLDDIHGGFPRFVFMNLGNNIINLIQGPGRTERKNTKSKNVTFVVKVYGLETSIEKNIRQKSSIIKKTSRENGVVTPNDFIYLTDLDKKDYNELLRNAGTIQQFERLEQKPTSSICTPQRPTFNSWFD